MLLVWLTHPWSVDSFPPRCAWWSHCTWSDNRRGDRRCLWSGFDGYEPRHSSLPPLACRRCYSRQPAQSIHTNNQGCEKNPHKINPGIKFGARRSRKEARKRMRKGERIFRGKWMLPKEIKGREIIDFLLVGWAHLVPFIVLEKWDDRFGDLGAWWQSPGKCRVFVLARHLLIRTFLESWGEKTYHIRFDCSLDETESIEWMMGRPQLQWPRSNPLQQDLFV